MFNFQHFIKIFNKNNHWKNCMLTGGNSASMFYKKISLNNRIMQSLQKFKIYLGDERCVSIFDKNSNYTHICNKLFSKSVLHKYNLNKMYYGNSSLDAVRYEKLLPNSIDLLLLSIGDDGHIASLFPHSPALKEKNRSVVTVFAPFPPYERLSITSKVIKNAKEVIVLALTPQKYKMYMEAKKNPNDIDSLPARLVLDRHWIFKL